MLTHKKFTISQKSRNKYFQGCQVTKNKMKHYLCMLVNDSAWKFTCRFLRSTCRFLKQIYNALVGKYKTQIPYFLNKRISKYPKLISHPVKFIPMKSTGLIRTLSLHQNDYKHLQTARGYW